MKNMNIVDCDVHVRELPEGIAEHCEMPWRKAVEAIAPDSAIPQLKQFPARGCVSRHIHSRWYRGTEDHLVRALRPVSQ